MGEGVKAGSPAASPSGTRRPVDGPPGRRRVAWAVSGALTTTIAANLAAFLTAGLAVQMQDDLHFGETALGAAIGVFYVAGAVSSAATGRVVERVGAERSLRMSAALSGVAMLAVAGLVRSFAVLMVLMALAGLANSWAQPASNVYLTRVVPPHRLGLALGLQKSAIPAGALLGGLAVPTLALTVGWRWAWVAGAVLAMVSTLQVPAIGGPPVARRAERGRRPDVPTRALVVLAVGVGLGAAGSGALSAFLVLSGVDAGLSETAAAVTLTGGSVAGIAVRLLVGARADRRPGGALTAVWVMFAVASASFLLLATGVAWLHVVATPVAFSTAYAWPGLFHLAVVRTNPSAPGAATGLTMTGTFTGAVSGPVIFGIVAGVTSYDVAWLVAAALLVGGAVIVAASRRAIREPGSATTAIAPVVVHPASVT